MTTIVNAKSELIVPRSVRRMAGIKSGTRVEFTVSGSTITIIPSVLADDDEYTPRQRRDVDAQLAIAQKGPFQGPFNSAKEMITHIEGTLNQRAASRKTIKPSR